LHRYVDYEKISDMSGSENIDRYLITLTWWLESSYSRFNYLSVLACKTEEVTVVLLGSKGGGDPPPEAWSPSWGTHLTETMGCLLDD
jgi:hypothetical protein